MLTKEAAQPNHSYQADLQKQAEIPAKHLAFLDELARLLADVVQNPVKERHRDEE